ncbi:TRAP-type mannitol/chloroaromatic compound transport system permease small subunit [Stella humosa]|uniref:TRAP transporter small permease protein n=1 Tax=Stella humosa TaxID=94 RepID=A0A3N1KQR2_9PROT|nr:TRAP transporter small permease [Stella humosa]ROP81129.1 TRAP-type mannitol/chloroaromatic compound transport system permease small subunit [Stella humosa]BBK32474.1 C4-dicarboxylate ABC transporter permease [Stella humosa]
MTTVLALAHRVSRFGLWFGGALVLLAAVLIGIDVVIRKFFSTSIGGADELAGYALAIGTSWGLGAALIERAHIRIDSLYVLFPNALRVVLDVAGLVLFVGFFALVAWHGRLVVEQSWISGSRSQSAIETPVVLPQVLWMAGMLLFFAVGVVLLIEALRRIFSGNVQGAVQLIGTRSAEEEVEEEIAALAAARHAGAGR